MPDMTDQGTPGFIKSALVTGVPFGLVFGAVAQIPAFIVTGGPFYFVSIALSSGLLFGVICSAFMRSSAVKEAVRINLPDGETVQYSGGANHFLGVEARGGYLYLTNRNLIFQPHDFNIQTEGVSIPLEEITEVKPILSLGIVPNGVAVTTRDGAINKFVVNQRKVWISRLRAACSV
jgi:hypothetical protein